MNSLFLTFFRWGEVPLKPRSYFLCVAFYFFIYLPYMDLLPLRVALVGPIIALVSFLPFFLRLRAKAHFSGFLMALCALYTYQTFDQVLGLLPGLAFLSMLAPLKLFEVKDLRDLYLYFLVLILLMVGAIVSVDSFYALIHVLVTIFSLFFLLANFDESSKSFRNCQKKKKILSSIFLISLPCAFALFLLFPRIQWGNFLFDDGADIGKSGFTDSLEPGTLASLVQDNSNFFRAEFYSQKIPNISGMYWRGGVLTTPSGFHWLRKGLSKSRIQREKGPDQYHYRVLFEERGGGNIFTLEDTYRVEPLARGKLFSDAGDSYRIENYNGKALSYEAHTAADTSEKLSPKEQTHLLKVQEEVSERMRDFVVNFHPNLSSRERLFKFLRYIQSEKFSYTLNPGLYSKENGLDEFFFERRVGFCEHYASLTATFARMMGIPSRVVVGFHGGLKNPYGNYYLIRGGDAHAWVEVWFENVGWQRIDPVSYIAPSRIELGASEYYELLSNYEGGFRRFLISGTSGLLGEVLLGLDLVFFRLNQSFIAYDVDAQKDFFTAIGLGKLSRLQLTLISFATVFVILLPLLLWVRNQKSQSLLTNTLYYKLQKKLSYLGIQAGAWQGPHTLSLLILKSEVPRREEVAQVLQKFAKFKYSLSDAAFGQKEMARELKWALSVIASFKRPKEKNVLECRDDH